MKEVIFKMKEPGDRTAEVNLAVSKLKIAQGDVCDAFEQDADRLFSNRECWYYKHGISAFLPRIPRKTACADIRSQ